MSCLIPNPNTRRNWHSVPLTVGLFVSESVFVGFLYAKKARHVPRKLTKKARDFLSKHVHVNVQVPNPKSLLSSSKHLISTLKHKAAKRIPFVSKKRGIPSAAAPAPAPKPAAVDVATSTTFYDDIRSISDFETEEFIESDSDDDEEEESNKTVDDGGHELWQKGILMGEKCAPPRFSGVIFYDIQGNQIDEPPQKVATEDLLDMLQREDHAGLWQRGILMGEKCTPPRFSGVIFYDVHGNRLNEPPPDWVPTSSTLFQKFQFPSVKE